MEFEFNKNLRIKSSIVAYDRRPDSVQGWAAQLGIVLTPPKRETNQIDTTLWSPDNYDRFKKQINKIK